MVKENFKEKKGETQYQSDVVIHRKGEFIFPITIAVEFDNGDKVRERWDGQARWTRYCVPEERQSIFGRNYPDHTIEIDRNDFNNSGLTEASGKATRKLTNYWTFLTQCMAQFMAWWMV